MEKTYLIIGLILISVFLLSLLSNVYHKHKQVKEFKAEVGQFNKKTLTLDELQAIQEYFKQSKPTQDTFIVDDITSNDLNIDELFLHFDSTKSVVGQEYFYKTLRLIQLNPEILKQRQQMADTFKNDEEKMLKTKEILASISQYSYQRSFYQDVKSLQFLSEKRYFIHKILSGIIVLGLIVLFIQFDIGMTIIIFGGFYNFLYYLKLKYVDHFNLEVFNTLISALIGLKKLDQINHELLTPYHQQIETVNKSFSSMRRGLWVGASDNNSIVQPIIDLFFGITHINFHKYYQMLRVYKKNADKLEDLYTVIGEVEVALIIFNLQSSHYLISQPEFIEEKVLEIKSMCHPLIEDCVANDLFMDQSVLITGSNASGKSTYIKVAAINVILAQTLHCSFSETYKAPIMKVLTSMALKDNLFEGESYFMVEIRSLNRILNEDKEIIVFGVIDEILRGTNTIERIAASATVLKELAQQNALILGATHDIELTQILNGIYENKHFQEQFENDDIVFDYKVKEGPSTSRNAIKLLELHGYADEVVKEAYQSVDYFETHQKWPQFKH